MRKTTTKMSAVLFTVAGLALMSCADDKATVSTAATTPSESTPADGPETTEGAPVEAPATSAMAEDPDGFQPLGAGFEGDADDCHFAGETEWTIDLLDDASSLVACPVGSPRIAELTTDGTGTLEEADLNGWALISVPGR